MSFLSCENKQRALFIYCSVILSTFLKLDTFLWLLMNENNSAVGREARGAARGREVR